MKTKTEIRQYMKELKNQLSKQEIQDRSKRIASIFLAQPFYQQAENIFLYVSYNQEVDTKKLIQLILRDGKHVAVPKVVDDHMEFHEITNLDQLTVGAFGILEPSINCPINRNASWESKKNLMIVPGLAFDKSGSRIGYGGGYYDRYIHNYPEQIGLKIALAYDFQVFEHIDIESFDEKIDGVITDKDYIGITVCEPQ
ncbi:5-formyltetrahydrofolate cyclo-ligase [Anaerosporobacter faecicola]|uniref:5-formyltetrahydrofolate cyclo-ligase n=1 Tax=Anaerosporobacter faecicola TaxID=2718714 RepID=UPI001438C837|nr:5-formyltetrahydrofolate cyclo-ligase [Anaerosporobacter faecicola]